MHRIPGPFKVYVGLVPTGYLNPEAIDQIVRDGIAFCGLSDRLQQLPREGRVLLKPDVLMADAKTARHCYTHPDVVRATAAQVLRLAHRTRITVLGCALEGVPASRVFRRANGQSDAYRHRGYYELENQFPGHLELQPADEAELVRYQLSKGDIHAESTATEANRLGRVANELVMPKHYHDSDFKIYCPKLKSSVITQGLRGAIGLGDNIFRGATADARLCDMLEVCNPDLIVSDGVIAAIGGNEITQRGHELGVILVSNNALAHDWVAAQIFNLDPMKIDHLRAAAERGWGPAAAPQIELGGAGADAVRQLAQKSRFWDLGYLPLDEFGRKFERENPGLAFPFEILSGDPYETAGAQGMLLDWLYLAYDMPMRRFAIGRWPRATVCVGDVKTYPSRYMVYAAGDRAIRALERITSSSRGLFRFGREQIQEVQLKSGRRHLVIRIPGSPPRVRDLARGFMIGSLGRIVPRFLTASLLLDRVVSALKSWSRPVRLEHDLRIVMTSRMPQNSWWALKNPLRHPLRERAEMGVFSHLPPPR